MAVLLLSKEAVLTNQHGYQILFFLVNMKGQKTHKSSHN